MSWADSSPGMQAGRMPVNGHDPEEDGAQYPKPSSQRKKVVVVGLGMVGIAFMCAFTSLIEVFHNASSGWTG